MQEQIGRTDSPDEMLMDKIKRESRWENLFVIGEVGCGAFAALCVVLFLKDLGPAVDHQSLETVFKPLSDTAYFLMDLRFLAFTHKMANLLNEDINSMERELHQNERTKETYRFLG